MYSKNAKAGMDNEQRRNEETGVGIGGFLEVIFEQVSRMLSLPGRKGVGNNILKEMAWVNR